VSRGDELAYPASRQEPYEADDGIVVGLHTVDHGGLTIREHAAIAAMQGILAGDHPITHGADCEAKTADVAVAMADALLAALSKPNGSEPKADSAADIEAYLVERSEWLKREMDNGGNLAYLSEKRKETDYILQNVRAIRTRNAP
jgi:hypothetical protein